MVVLLLTGKLEAHQHLPKWSPSIDTTLHCSMFIFIEMPKSNSQTETIGILWLDKRASLTQKPSKK